MWASSIEISNIKSFGLCCIFRDEHGCCDHLNGHQVDRSKGATYHTIL
jgi:hypothetical protein